MTWAGWTGQDWGVVEAYGQKLVVDNHLLVVTSTRRTAFGTEGGAIRLRNRYYAQLALDAGRAFSPVAPIDERALLAGRTARGIQMTHFRGYNT